MDADHPLGALGHVGLVRDEDDRAALRVQLVEELQDVAGGRRVQVARGLVGEQQGQFPEGGQFPGGGPQFTQQDGGPTNG